MIHEVSSEVPDWVREQKRCGVWNLGKSLLASIRIYQKCLDGQVPFAFVRKPLAVLQHRFWRVVTGADIPLNCSLGGGLLLPQSNGVVIHSKAKIGKIFHISQQVTIGAYGDTVVPVLGGRVDIGAGARLLGGTRVGDQAVIGANAVVLCDVPPRGLAVGVPAVVRGAE